MTDPSASIRRKTEQLIRRKRHVAKKLYGTPERPRLVVYRSNKNIYAQLVDDVNHKTITGCSSITADLKEQISGLKGNIEVSKLIGKRIASLAESKGIKMVAFDRNGRRYHGRVKAVADGAREGGLKF